MNRYWDYKFTPIFGLAWFFHVLLTVLKSVWDSKEGIAAYDFFNSDSLLMGPIPNKKVCFSIAC